MLASVVSCSGPPCPCATSLSFTSLLRLPHRGLATSSLRSWRNLIENLSLGSKFSKPWAGFDYGPDSQSLLLADARDPECLKKNRGGSRLRLSILP